MKKLIILAISTITMISLSACGKEDNTLTDDSLTEITTQATTEVITVVTEVTEVTTSKKQQMQAQGVDIVDDTPNYNYIRGSWQADMDYWTGRLDMLKGIDGKNLQRLQADLESGKAQYERKSQPDESQWLFEGELENLDNAIKVCEQDIEIYHRDLKEYQSKIAELEAIPVDER